MSQTIIHTEKDFLAGPLAVIASAVRRLNAVLVNPGREEALPPVPSGKPTLRISLVNDEIDPSQLETMVLEKVAATQSSGDEPLLLAIYLPDQQFHQFYHLILRLREQYPDAMIVALACSCQQKFKNDALTSLLAKEIINFAVVDQICGGGQLMTAIANQLIKLWP